MGNSRNRLELHAELTRLRPFLKEHFEGEEAPGGLFASVRDAGIASERAMAGLERSHRDMIESLDRIVGALGRSNAQPLDVAPELDALLRAIESHEVLEDDLLHALLGRELGGGD